MNPRGGERLAREHAFGIVLLQVHHRERDAFGDDDEIGMLKPQRVGLNLSPIDEAQQIGPKLALERLGGMQAKAGPQPPQLGIDAAIGDAVLA